MKKDQTEEVEIKVRIDSSEIESIKKRLLDLGAIHKGVTRESDTYFTAPHRDFIKTRECLRIREKEGYLEMTYKGVTTELMNNKKQFWKPEINIPLNSNKEDVELFLESLNFTKVVEVNKKREKFELKDQEISFDEIEGLGHFLEIENSANNTEERLKALDENRSLFERLNLREEDIVTEPYRDLVLKRLR